MEKADALELGPNLATTVVELFTALLPYTRPAFQPNLYSWGSISQSL